MKINLNMIFNRRPNGMDVIVSILFVVLVSFPVYLFHHEIIYLDQGLYLPGINAILEGKIPFKDFMFYRGPFEIYAPALLMKYFGNTMTWLPIFFYVGTMVNIILALLIGFELYRTRLIFLLMVPVFLTRTFPRVSFYYWGGMRYALAMAGIYFAVKFFKLRKPFWMFGAGIVTAAGFFTTIEAGVSAGLAVLSGMMIAFFFKVMDTGTLKKALGWYVLGLGIVTLPFLCFLAVHGALVPYWEATVFFPTRMTSTYLDMGTHIPVNFWHFLLSLFNPGSQYFKVLTPVYFFFIFIGYMLVRYKARQLNSEFVCLASIVVYGLILYIASFRAIWGHHFEMALQPEKILYFFLIEEAYRWILVARPQWSSGHRLRRLKLYLSYFFIFALVMSSLGYSFARAGRHFPLYKIVCDKLAGKPSKDYSLLRDQEKKFLMIERAKGMIVPAWQAEDIEQTVDFITRHTQEGEAVLTYPELGNFNYWCDRPFIGRFPIATLSWADEGWHREYVEDIKRVNPRYVIMTNLGHRTFPSQLYFKFPGNIVKFKEVTGYILKNYKPVKTLSSLTIYEHQ